MPPYRQDLSGVKDDGTLVGKGGRTQQLGRAATQRLAESRNSVPQTKPAAMPPPPAPTPAAAPAASTKPLQGYDEQALMDRLSAVAPPPGATGTAVPPGILGRMAQLARERGMMPGDSPPIVDPSGLEGMDIGARPDVLAAIGRANGAPEAPSAPAPLAPPGVGGAAPPAVAPKPLAGYAVGPTGVLGGPPAGGIKPGLAGMTGGGLRPPAPRPRPRNNMGDLGGTAAPA